MEDEIILTCGECEKEFKGERGLKYHMKQIHSEGKDKVECNQCKEVLSKSYIKNHKKLIHGEAKVRFACSDCEKIYNSWQYIEKHIMEKHNKTPEKKN